MSGENGTIGEESGKSGNVRVLRSFWNLNSLLSRPLSCLKLYSSITIDERRRCQYFLNVSFLGVTLL